MVLSRRQFLKGVGALGAGAYVHTLGGCEAEYDGLPRYAFDGGVGSTATFSHGVASGDPLPDAVLLWTRVTVDEPGAPVEVFLEVSESPTMWPRLAAAYFETDAASDHTLTVDVFGLRPARHYYYRFSALGRRSVVGRTRSAPFPSPDSVRLGVVSCSNYAFGHFHAYRHLAAVTDLDAVVHLGDYLYEYANPGWGPSYGGFRELVPPHEVVTLSDYRARYAHYRRDPDLRELHRLHPMIHVWDDHEFADDPNRFGAYNHQPGEEGPWRARVEAARRAYAEWMPTRLHGEGSNRIYRALELGDRVDLLLLDRHRRHLWPSVEDGGAYLGSEQERWLLERIAEHRAQWLVLGQGAPFTPRDAALSSGSDWDAASRTRLLRAVAAREAPNLCILTGDVHAFEAYDVVEPELRAYEGASGAGAFGVELACGSVTSPGRVAGSEGIPHAFFRESRFRGYVLVEYGRERMTASFHGFPDEEKTRSRRNASHRLASFTCEDRANHLSRTQGAS